MQKVKEKEIITQKEVKAAKNASYRVKTITPLVNDPVKREYILTQEELNSLFEDYNLFAEFVISIKKIN
jgi:hypothetical protein